MVNFLSDREYLTYDDILIQPKQSLLSRKYAQIYNCIIPAPMDSISGPELCEIQLKERGIAVLHRYLSVKEKIECWQKFEQWRENFFIGVGINKQEILTLLQAGVYNFCIDIANAYHPTVAEIIREIKQGIKDRMPTLYFRIMVGNVATPEGYSFLKEAGADLIKVGIGGGSLCTTRLITGCGVPQLSAIMKCAKVKGYTKLIADGGIKNSGDCVKALVAGADYVMVGGLISGVDESPGPIIDGHKIYRGMASLEAQVDFYGQEPITPEGIETKVKCKGPYKKVLDNILGGIKSGMSYVGAKDIYELRNNASFIKVSSNTLIENRPHGKV